jgi:hypothetical protein
VSGYRIYAGLVGEPLALVLDAALPAAGPDGTLAAVVSGLDPCRVYAFAATAYRPDGSESVPSNEVVLDADPVTCAAPDPCAGRADGRTRLKVRASRSRTRVFGRASFAGLSRHDVTTGEVGVTVHDAAGALLLDLVAPGGAFSVASGRRARYRDDRHADGGGLTTIVVMTGPRSSSLTLHATLPASATTGGAGARFDWRVRTSTGCIAGMGRSRSR